MACTIPNPNFCFSYALCKCQVPIIFHLTREIRRPRIKIPAKFHIYVENSNNRKNNDDQRVVLTSEFSPTLWQMFAKYAIFARFAIFVKFALFVDYGTATGRVFNISFEFSPTFRPIFAGFAFLPLRAFLDISGFLSYFMTLSSSPTLEIEPTAYCWFARDASAPNIGGQEEKCPSPLRTKKILLIADVTTLSHDCKPRIRTSA